MDILAVTHYMYMYLEMNIETFFELKWAFLQRWLYYREHLKYVWNVNCVVANHRNHRKPHTTETTGNERFPIGHGTNYFRIV